MSLFYEVIEFIAGFVELFVAYMVLSSIFQGKRQEQRLTVDMILAVLGAMIVFICNRDEFYSYLTIVITAVYLSVSAKLFYKVNLITLFSAVSFYLLCLNCFEFLIITVISFFCGGPDILLTVISGTEPFRAIVTSLIRILWVALYFVLRCFLLPVNKREIPLLLLTSGVGFLGFVYLSNHTVKALKQTIPILWFVFVCVLAFILFSVYYMVMRQEVRHKLEILEMRNNLLCENYNTLNKIYMSNSKLYHDLNNHLNVLYQLLEDEKTDEARSYIKEISKPILQLSKTVWTGIDVVDVVLNSKLMKMEELGITSDINVEFPQHSNILPNDICTVLANLLDNAIEAVERIEDERYISITIRHINYFLFIRVVNPCHTTCQFTDIPETTKKNNILHGWGLRNVYDTVDKYDGTMELKNENNKFIVTVMLSFDDEE